MIKRPPLNSKEARQLLWGDNPPYTTTNAKVAKWRWRKYCKPLFSHIPWWWLRRLGLKYWTQIRSMSMPEYRKWARKYEGVPTEETVRKESYAK